jgi:hypothetical protein
MAGAGSRRPAVRLWASGRARGAPSAGAVSEHQPAGDNASPTDDAAADDTAYHLDRG